MNLTNRRTGPVRVLIARGLHTAVILAHDSRDVACDVENISDNAEEVLTARIPDEPGIYLFEGDGEMVGYNSPEGCEPPEMQWSGTCRPVMPHEFAGLIAMEPPDEDLTD